MQKAFHGEQGKDLLNWLCTSVSNNRCDTKQGRECSVFYGKQCNKEFHCQCANQYNTVYDTVPARSCSRVFGKECKTEVDKVYEVVLNKQCQAECWTR